MDIILHLPPGTEAKLLEQARSTGANVESLALQAVLASIASAEPDPSLTVMADEWLRLFDAWVGSHESRNPRLDDSREGFYPDRW